MTQGLRPYPKYKDSGVPWLGDVPEHWEIRRGKAIFRCIDVRSRTGKEELLTVSSERGVVPRRSANVTMFKAESYVGYKLCWPGDLVINSLWAWARGLGVSPYHGIVSSAYGVYRLRNERQDNPRFIHQLVRSTPFQWELQVRSKGIWVSRLQLTDDAFLGAPFPMPPSDEQTAIVRFLDYADRRIRRVIRLRNQRIKLLEEYKQALINRTVTGKIDVRTGKPYPKYKNSGVEWLGEVPEHWKVVPLRWFIFIQSGDFIETSSVDSRPSKERPYPVIGGNGVLGYAGVHNSKGITVVIGRVGALCGNVHLVDGPAWITDNALRITRIREFQAQFLSIQLRIMDLNRLANANAQPLVTGGMIKAQRIVKPPMDEQLAIVSFLDEQTERIDAAITADRRVIDLLKEFRTRLIADVVTGKLDVREAAASLPNELEPDNEIDATESDENVDTFGSETPETV